MEWSGKDAEPAAGGGGPSLGSLWVRSPWVLAQAALPVNRQPHLFFAYIFIEVSLLYSVVGLSHTESDPVTHILRSIFFLLWSVMGY